MEIIQESEEEIKREQPLTTPDGLRTPAPPNPKDQGNMHAQMLGRLFYGKDVERKVICDWNDFGEPLSECSHAVRRHSVRRPFPPREENDKSEVLKGGPRGSKLRESMKLLQHQVPTPIVTDPFSVTSKHR